MERQEKEKIVSEINGNVGKLAAYKGLIVGAGLLAGFVYLLSYVLVYRVPFPFLLSELASLLMVVAFLGFVLVFLLSGFFLLPIVGDMKLTDEVSYGLLWIYKIRCKVGQRSNSLSYFFVTGIPLCVFFILAICYARGDLYFYYYFLSLALAFVLAYCQIALPETTSLGTNYEAEPDSIDQQKEKGMFYAYVSTNRERLLFALFNLVLVGCSIVWISLALFVIGNIFGFPEVMWLLFFTVAVFIIVHYILLRLARYQRVVVSAINAGVLVASLLVSPFAAGVCKASLNLLGVGGGIERIYYFDKDTVGSLPEELVDPQAMSKNQSRPLYVYLDLGGVSYVRLSNKHEGILYRINKQAVVSEKTKGKENRE